MSETLQKIILDTLESQSSINDSRSLVLPGKTQPASANEDQIMILGALNSLVSREVSNGTVTHMLDLQLILKCR